MDNKQKKTAGEHWTAAALSRREWAPALTRDGIERTDILAVGAHLPERPMLELQVKTASRRGQNTTWLLGNPTDKHARGRHEWFVLVIAPPVPEDLHAFLVPRDVVTAMAWVVHQWWRTDPDVPVGKRNASVAQSRVAQSVFAAYHDRWDLLGTPTADLPVLLEPKWRERAQLQRVGLPAGHPWREGLPSW